MADISLHRQNVEGQVAHDDAVAGNPLIIGGVASLNEPTVVSADGDAVQSWYDLFGRPVILLGHANPETPVTVNATATGDTAVLAAPGASVSFHLITVILSNVGNQDIEVFLQETASAVNRFGIMLASGGGGVQIPFGSHGWKLTANTGLDINIPAGTPDVHVNVVEHYIAP